MRYLVLILMLVCTTNMNAQSQKVDSIELKENIKKLDKTLSEIQVISKKIEHEEKVRLSLFKRLQKFFRNIGNEETLNKNRERTEFLREALKPDEYQPIIISQKPQIEQRPKTFFGRLFSKDNYRYFKYVVTDDSTRVYLGEIKKHK